MNECFVLARAPDTASLGACLLHLRVTRGVFIVEEDSRLCLARSTKNVDLFGMESVSLRDLCKFCKQINVNTIVSYFPPDLGDDGVQVCLHHQPTYNALQVSAETCPLFRLFYAALDRKNASRHPPEAFKAHENSQIWLVSGDQAFFDLRQPKGLYYLRVTFGSGTLLKDADFTITKRPSGR